MCEIRERQRTCKYRNWKAHLSPELLSVGHCGVSVGREV